MDSRNAKRPQPLQPHLRLLKTPIQHGKPTRVCPLRFVDRLQRNVSSHALADTRSTGDNPPMSLPYPSHCLPCPLPWHLPSELGSLALQACRYPPALPLQDFADCAIHLPTRLAQASSKRQAEYLAGRCCARAALAALGCPGWDAPQQASGAPAWPTGRIASISHGQGWALAVAARQTHWQAIGLDVERCLSTQRSERLLRQLLTPAEISRLPAHPEHRARQITLSFSAKESLYKALHPLCGVSFFFQDAELVAAGDGQLRLRLLRDLHDDWLHGRELQGYYWALEDSLVTLVVSPASVQPPGNVARSS